MEQLIVILIVVAIGASLLKKYLEKQQREQEATKQEALREAQRRHQLGELKEQLGVLASTNRPDEETPARPPSPAMPSQQRHATQRTATVAPRPAAAAPRHHKQAARHATDRPGRQAPATTAAAGKQPHPARPVQAKRRAVASLGTVEAPIASSLGSSAAFRPTRPRGGADYLGGMLRGGNLARAIVLSEILGPPKALE